MRLTREQMLARRVRIVKSHTSWVPVGTIGLVTDLPKFGGVGVRIQGNDIIYPPGASHPHIKHDYETFHFKITDVKVLLTEDEQ